MKYIKFPKSNFEEMNLIKYCGLRKSKLSVVCTVPKAWCTGCTDLTELVESPKQAQRKSTQLKIRTMYLYLNI